MTVAFAPGTGRVSPVGLLDIPANMPGPDHYAPGVGSSGENGSTASRDPVVLGR